MAVLSPLPISPGKSNKRKSLHQSFSSYLHLLLMRIFTPFFQLVAYDSKFDVKYIEVTERHRACKVNAIIRFSSSRSALIERIDSDSQLEKRKRDFLLFVCFPAEFPVDYRCLPFHCLDCPSHEVLEKHQVQIPFYEQRLATLYR